MLDQELANHIVIDGHGDGCPNIQINYDWQPRLCSICMVFGHESSECIGNLDPHEASRKCQHINSDKGQDTNPAP